MPFSKMKMAIADILSAKGFIGKVSQKGKTPQTKLLEIELIYDEAGNPRITDVHRISKPSRRLYEKAKKIRSYRKGFGISVLSTSKGIKTDMEAKKENLGGETLFTIW